MAITTNYNIREPINVVGINSDSKNIKPGFNQYGSTDINTPNYIDQANPFGPALGAGRVDPNVQSAYDILIERIPQISGNANVAEKARALENYFKYGIQINGNEEATALALLENLRQKLGTSEYAPENQRTAMHYYKLHNIMYPRVDPLKQVKSLKQLQILFDDFKKYQNSLKNKSK